MLILNIIGLFLVSFALSKEIVIGYRSVEKEKGKAYTKAGTLVDFPARNRQLGEGVYLTPGPAQYDGGESKCVVYADSEAFEALDMMWIPQYDDCGNLLWFADDDVIDDYIRKNGGEPRKTVRFSRIQSKMSADQVVLTTGMLNGNGGGLKIRVKCEKKWRKLPTQEVANLEGWSIEGSRDDGVLSLD